MRQRTARPSETDARKKFDRFKREPPKQIRGIHVEGNEAIEQIAEAVRKVDRFIRGEFKYTAPDLIDRTCMKASEVIAGIEYDADDIEGFTFTMHDRDTERLPFFGPATGHVISALINNGRDQDYIVHTEFLTRVIQMVGYRNTKNITIEGGCDYVGWKMSAGRIIVNGNAMNGVGRFMRGGEIYIEGAYNNIIGEDMIGGKIFHNGRLVIGK